MFGNRDGSGVTCHGWVVSAAVILLVSCGDAAQNASNTVTRDSAGVQLVDNDAPRWRQGGEGWQLGASPSMSIGLPEGDSMYLFDGVAGVQRLGDGRIVVADAGSSQLRFFDSAGRFLSSVGRSGEGPGEFQFIGQMWTLPGDTLAVTDLPGLVILDPEGMFVRLTRLPIAEGTYSPAPAGQLTDGTILAMSGSRGFGPRDVGTVIRDSLRFYWYTVAGEYGGRLAVLPSAERWGLNAGGIITFPYVPFSGNPIWTAGRDRFVIGPGTESTFTVWRRDGTIERIVRWAAPRRAVTGDLLSRYRDHILATARDGNARRRNEVFLSEVPVAQHVPTHRSAIVDDEGSVWVEEYRVPWETNPRWDVFTREGVWLGSVSTPARFTIHHIGDDFVLGVWRDDSDIEYVRLFELVR